MTGIADYIQGLTIGQGRYAGQPFKLLGWQRRSLRGAFNQPDDAALSMGRGGGKSTFTAAIACAAVDVGGPLVEPMGECLVIASSFDQGLVIRAATGNWQSTSRAGAGRTRGTMLAPPRL